MIELDIFIDPICPWCYLGKARLDQALAARPDHPFVISWQPFQIAPHLPATGVDRADYLLGIFGTQERTVAAHLHLQKLGADSGIAFDFAAMTRTPNSLNAHRLIHWAGLEGRQDDMIETLFRAYWTQGKDIGNLQILADLARECGMDRTVILRLLTGDADRDAIMARINHARTRGVSSVPTCIVDNHHVISGAQTSDFWQQLISEITRKSDVQ